jgi:DNA mismatch repair protein MSH6
MTKMPDLERLTSRIHAGVCRPDNFVKVLEGFEQIDYTMSLLSSFGGGNGTISKDCQTTCSTNDHPSMM